MARRLRPVFSLMCLIVSLAACSGRVAPDGPVPSDKGSTTTPMPEHELTTTTTGAPVPGPAPATSGSPDGGPAPGGTTGGAPGGTTGGAPSPGALPAGSQCVGSGAVQICVAAGGSGSCREAPAAGADAAATCTLVAGDQLCIVRGSSSNCTTASGPTTCDVSVVGNSVNRNCNG